MQIMSQFVVKLAYTDRRCFYNIPPHWTVKYAFLRIRDYIVEDFDIDNAFELVHVDSIPHSYTDQLEEYKGQPHIYLDSGELVGNYFNNVELNTFYIKRIECEDYETHNGCIERVAI